MGEKSYVSLSASTCPVCGQQFENGELIIDRRLKDSLDRVTVVDMRLCPKHQRLADEGYIALIAIDPGKSTFLENGNLKPQGAWRTGDIIHVRRSVAEKMFTVPVPEVPFMYCEQELIEILKKMAEDAED